MRFEGPHCHQPTRFGPHPTPPVSPTFARKATAHGSLVTPPHFLFGVIISYRTKTSVLGNHPLDEKC